MGPLLPCRMPNEQPAESIAARRTPVHCRRSSGPWDQRPLVRRRHVTRHEVSGPCAHASFDLEWPRPAGAQTVCTVEGTGWLGFYYGASEIRSMSAHDVRKEGSDRAVRGAGRPPHVPLGGGLPLHCRLVLRGEGLLGRKKALPPRVDRRDWLRSWAGVAEDAQAAVAVAGEDQPLAVGCVVTWRPQKSLPPSSMNRPTSVRPPAP